MRAPTITTNSRPGRRARYVVLALALGVSALAISVSASASRADTPVHDSGDSALNGQPPVVSDSPPTTGDGFDWSSAAVGAGAVLALLALGGAALLTVRSRTAMSPPISARSRRGASGDAEDGR